MRNEVEVNLKLNIDLYTQQLLFYKILVDQIKNL
jgi:hypothetical protein